MFEAEKRGREFLRAKGMEDRIIDFTNTDITAESTALALNVYLDLSIRTHLGETVFPGIGGEDSVVELTVKELEKLSDPVCWVGVTK